MLLDCCKTVGMIEFDHTSEMDRNPGRDGVGENVKVALREDLHPDVSFYYDCQFKIYREPYLIWDKDTWSALLAICAVYSIVVDGNYAGDILLEDRGKGTKYIVDFGLLPEYQRMGIGRVVLGQIKKMGKRLTAVTRKETIQFFLKSGFALNRRMKDYYDAGVDGYYIVFPGKPTEAG
jgi:ribosomal protein S18 acetylase RimI-like enzyme